jgi:hypothetical protein
MKGDISYAGRLSHDIYQALIILNKREVYIGNEVGIVITPTLAFLAGAKYAYETATSIAPIDAKRFQSIPSEIAGYAQECLKNEKNTEPSVCFAAGFKAMRTLIMPKQVSSAAPSR